MNHKPILKIFLVVFLLSVMGVSPLYAEPLSSPQFQGGNSITPTSGPPGTQVTIIAPQMGGDQCTVSENNIGSVVVGNINNQGRLTFSIPPNAVVGTSISVACGSPSDDVSLRIGTFSVTSAVLAAPQYFSQFQFLYTPLRPGGQFTPGDLSQATDGRFFILEDFSPSGSNQVLGLLISSFDQTLLLDYLNSIAIYFEAVPVPSSQVTGFGTFPAGGQQTAAPSGSSHIDVELALLPRGNVNRNQTYAVYFSIDPTIYQAGQSHLYHSPTWQSVQAWVVATRGSVDFTMWRNNPSGYTRTTSHTTGRPTPTPLTDDVSPQSALYNALVTGEGGGSAYRIYGGFTGQPRTITPPSEIEVVNDSCPDNLPPRMTVGRRGLVTDTVPLPNRMRSQPSLSGSQIGKVPAGELFTVVGGPVCANEITWWQIDYAGLVGWTAEGAEDEYYIEPFGR